MIRVAIVDDQPEFRHHLTVVLDGESDIEVVASTDDPAVALAAGELDVVTVDPFADPARPALDVVRRLSDVLVSKVPGPAVGTPVRTGPTAVSRTADRCWRAGRPL